jgi:dephospho-CoA kinase
VTLVVGLTGGIGSGKSAVAAAFRARGIEVIDADDVAQALSAPGATGHAAVAGQLGREYVAADGTLDRAGLRERAFADPAFRARLEGLLHPLIAAAIDREIAQWRGPYGILVVPLLLERGGLSRRVARVLVVDCPEDEQLRRAVARGGLTAEAARAIMATQLPRAARLARADDILDNAGPPERIGPQVDRLDTEYRALANQRA